jgi:hypothetical protein
MAGDQKSSVAMSIAAENQRHLESLKEAMGGVSSAAQAQKLLESMSAAKGVREVLENQVLSTARQYQEALRSMDLASSARDVLAAMDVARGLRDTIASFNPGKALQDAIGSINSAQALNNLLGVHKTIVDLHQAPALFDIARQVGEASKVFHNLSQGPLFEIARTMESLSAFQSHIQELVVSHRRPIEEFARALQAFSPVEWPAIYKLPQDAVALSADGTVTVDGASVSLTQIQAAVEQVLEKTNARGDERIEQQLRILVEETKKIQQPLLQQIVFFFLLPTILAILTIVLTPIADHYIKEHLNKDRRALKRGINAEVAQLADKSSLSVFRMVTASTLYVREQPSSKSTVVGTLHFGQAVLLIEKAESDRSWAHVRWTNEDATVSIEGWVFARYLEKFK